MEQFLKGEFTDEFVAKIQAVCGVFKSLNVDDDGYVKAVCDFDMIRGVGYCELEFARELMVVETTKEHDE